MPELDSESVKHVIAGATAEAVAHKAEEIEKLEAELAQVKEQLTLAEAQLEASQSEVAAAKAEFESFKADLAAEAKKKEVIASRRKELSALSDDWFTEDRLEAIASMDEATFAVLLEVNASKKDAAEVKEDVVEDSPVVTAGKTQAPSHSVSVLENYSGEAK